MKKLMGAAFAGVLLFSGGAFAAEQTAKFKMSGWSCGSCAGKTVKALKAVEGVTEASGDVATKTVTVTFDDAKVTQADLDKAFAAVNYKAEKID
jgi:copper chaperone CopZ